MYVATVGLSSCGGCLDSLLLAGEPLVALLAEHDISFSSLLVDRRGISPSDVVLAAGCIRNELELETVLEVARTSRKVIAVGSCAVLGGIPCMARLDRAEGSREGADEETLLPELLREGEPLDSRIDIDCYVPGCPPQPFLVFEALKSVLQGYNPLHFETTVCSDCPRVVQKGPVKSFTTHPGCDARDGLCLLGGGYLCLGPVTRGGCRAACPSRGAACIGCRGPSDMVLSSQLHSFYTDMVKYVALMTSGREDRVEKKLSPILETLYLFTRRDPATRSRVKEKIPVDSGGTVG